jgi:hypothetical protein
MRDAPPAGAVLAAMSDASAVSVQPKVMEMPPPATVPSMSAHAANGVHTDRRLRACAPRTTAELLVTTLRAMITVASPHQPGTRKRARVCKSAHGGFRLREEAPVNAPPAPSSAVLPPVVDAVMRSVLPCDTHQPPPCVVTLPLRLLPVTTQLRAAHAASGAAHRGATGHGVRVCTHPCSVSSVTVAR